GRVRAGGPRPDPSRQPPDAGGAHDPEHAGHALRLDQQPAADQAGEPHARVRLAAGLRATRPRGVPGGPALMAVGTAAARARVERLDRIWQERPGLTGWLTT